MVNALLDKGYNIKKTLWKNNNICLTKIIVFWSRLDFSEELPEKDVFVFCDKVQFMLLH